MDRIVKVKKRDGTIVDFNQDRITDAIHKALVATDSGTKADALKISDEVVILLNEKFKGMIPPIEDIQTIVVEVLKEKGFKTVADEYDDYRKKKEEIRGIKKELGIDEEPKLTVNSLEVLRKRYLLKNDKGENIETPAQMFRRVASAIASADRKYGSDVKRAEESFFRSMSKLEFLPNSPTLFNAGTGTNFAMSACYVLPVEDSLEGIFTTLKNMALIEQTGGGVGFDFSRLRPSGDIVRSTKGVASGPVSFMRIFDTATDVIKSGGKRRGAMMAVLRVDHPDILEFITSKSKQNILTNFNISVAATDKFMNAVEKGEDYDLINPRTGKIVKKLNASEVWDKMMENAWQSGDPGVVFIDEINRHNPTPRAGKIEATNPCGEQPLLPYESCNLGSINLSRMITRTGELNWEKIRDAIHNSVHFLDNVIDVNPYPLEEIDIITRLNRKIGLGVMGFADLLIRMNIPYDSNDALDLGEKIAAFFEKEAVNASEELAMQRGIFPNFSGSIWSDKSEGRRNATVTTIAPTGTISIIAGCSSGIEPLFAVAFMRHVLGGARLFEINPLFERIAKDRGFYSVVLMEKIAKYGTIQNIKEIPEDVRRIFVTAHDISPQWHVKMQAAFQKHTENAVSKTVNLPQNSTPEDIEKIYMMAYKLKCKGVTVYRYGSKGEQVLNLGLDKEEAKRVVTASEEYAGGKPTVTCQTCG
ncbi:ribonucleoside-diphosphate reductase, adenosylcobalamin-dependent [Methanocella sp. CWC-04]|uniref:Vitamin B12-dependent ribonucleotide reductase n=1 Tax=Methanooceanicella nereidis TaxID=2052831 RepID=A0AAP2RD23_9EURY|nr:adenosylcobalamin-dependent ribonucleoside-diphosphate reductase [Methanocella sp. CWC-04]MCD1295294.1 ribonucleoside-diphosphate reductase, adenosylcobalamin-dependent [Methanocella sp. CWC-04]